MSDSHTGFSSGAFTAGAVGGALGVAGAFVGAVQAAAQLNAQRWERFDRGQLEAVATLSEELKMHYAREAEELRAENAKLLVALRRVSVRRAAA